MLLSPDALQTLTVIGVCFSMLVFSRLPADAILVGGVCLLLVLNIVTPDEALLGLANEGMATVAVLFVVARGLAQTGVVGWISSYFLGRPAKLALAQFRLMLPVAA